MFSLYLASAFPLSYWKPFNIDYCLIGTENAATPYESLPGIMLPLDKSIRFCAVANKLGYIISSKYRKGLQPLMTVEETERYALHATIRNSTRQAWEGKIGKVRFAMTRYELLTRVTVPLPESHLLLISFDVEAKNVDGIMVDKVIPVVNRNT